MIDFSFIIPTRQRPELLAQCLDSIFRLAANPERIECLIMADYDDQTFEYRDLALRDNVRAIVQKRSDYLIRDYGNFGAKCSSGRFVCCFNDDMEVVTPQYDEILLAEIDPFMRDKPDGLVYVAIHDSVHNIGNRQKSLGCCCPFLSRRVVDLMGGLPDVINAWGADVAMYDIFKSLPQQRILDCSERVAIKHHCCHNNTRGRDATNRRMEQVSRKGFLTPGEKSAYVSLLCSAFHQELN